MQAQSGPFRAVLNLEGSVLIPRPPPDYDMPQLASWQLSWSMCCSESRSDLRLYYRFSDASFEKLTQPVDVALKNRVWMITTPPPRVQPHHERTARSQDHVGDFHSDFGHIAKLGKTVPVVQGPLENH